MVKWTGLVLSVPLWDSGGRKGALGEAINDLNAADLRHRQRLEELTVALRDALAGYRSSIRVYRANLKALELAEDSYGITLSSFRSGVVSQAQLNDAELLLTSARLRTVQSLYDVNMRMAFIEKLSGREGG